MSPKRSVRGSPSSRGKGEGSSYRRILEAALESFSTQGFSAATLESIRERSGASTGSIYHHFKSKEQLAAALYVEGLRDYQQGLLSRLLSAKEAASGVRALVRVHLDWVEEHPDWARYLLEFRRSEAGGSTELEIRSLNEALVASLQAWCAPFVSSGGLRRLPVELFLAVALGPAQEYSRLWLSGRAPTPISKAKRLLADAAWDATRGHVTQREEDA